MFSLRFLAVFLLFALMAHLSDAMDNQQGTHSAAVAKVIAAAPAALATTIFAISAPNAMGGNKWRTETAQIHLLMLTEAIEEYLLCLSLVVK
ncbi:hypothetical protein niasHT_021029 [Heterodera trifolii]|uniref:Uncharacterized protein n=1 Tax=Heterodera trifolii TaxID=157864 RepID=A0ABD2KDM9_9BILA